MKRRRSSVTIFADALEDMVLRRRSSFETIMHLNVVEDIARLDHEADVSEGRFDCIEQDNLITPCEYIVNLSEICLVGTNKLILMV